MFPFIDSFIYLDHDLSLKWLNMRPVFEKLNNGYHGDILKAISDNKKVDFSTIALFCLQIQSIQAILNNFVTKVTPDQHGW